jgi:hypothetical protein
MYQTESSQAAQAGTVGRVIDAILEEDQTKPAKQRHTAQRIFDRLRVVTRKFQGVEDGG